MSVYFAGVNFEEEDSANNLASKLNRYEFIELMIRIAKGKFMDFGKMTSLLHAVQKLFNEHVFPMLPKLV